MWLVAQSGMGLDEQRLHLYAIKVVHSQDGASLVFIAEKTEAFGLPCLLVPHQVDIDNLTIPDRDKRTSEPSLMDPGLVATLADDLLGEDTDDVAFR